MCVCVCVREREREREKEKERDSCVSMPAKLSPEVSWGQLPGETCHPLLWFCDQTAHLTLKEREREREREREGGRERERGREGGRERASSFKVMSSKAIQKWSESELYVHNKHTVQTQASPSPLSPSRSTPPNRDTAPAGFFFTGAVTPPPDTPPSGRGRDDENKPSSSFLAEVEKRSASEDFLDEGFGCVVGGASFWGGSPKRSASDDRCDDGLGWVGGGAAWASPFWAEGEAKISLLDDFPDFLGITLGDAAAFPPDDVDAVEAVNKSSLPAFRSGANPFSFKGSDFPAPENRFPPLRGSEVGGEPKRSVETAGAGLTPDFFFPLSWVSPLSLDVFLAAAVAEEEVMEEEKRSSTCGFLARVVIFPGAGTVTEEKRSSSDSSSSKRPPSFSFGFDGATFFVLFSFSIDFFVSSDSAR